MKRIIFIQPLKYHNLVTGKVTRKIHIEILGMSVRIPYWGVKSKYKTI